MTVSFENLDSTVMLNFYCREAVLLTSTG